MIWSAHLICLRKLVDLSREIRTESQACLKSDIIPGSVALANDVGADAASFPILDRSTNTWFTELSVGDLPAAGRSREELAKNAFERR